MKNQKLISVIVPVYNIEKYVSKCIESILRQTYSNLEIILVDDGSTDNSSNILNIFSRKDNRIKVLRKENGGLSDARNYGLDRAKGDYIFFIDGDDYISDECIEFLENAIEVYNADISTTQFIRYYENEEPNASDGRNMPYTTTKALERLLYQKNCTTSAWGKLYKKSLFDNIRYPKGKICEDLPITYKLFARANKVVIGKSKHYFYLQRENSIIYSKFKPARADALKFAKEETDFIKEHFPKLKKAALNREFMENVYVYSSIISSKDNKYKDILLNVKESIKHLRITVLTDPKAPLMTKMYALLGVENIKKIRKYIKNV